MDHIYDNPDPREYFRELGNLDYTLPGVAKHPFRVLISHLQRSRDDAINILDLGCSYGVNAALLKHDLSMTDLYSRWGQDRFEDATAEEVLADSDCVTEKLEGCTFRQRRFVSTQEREAFVKQLDSRGLDASGKEADGYPHAEFCLSRPKEETESMPIEAFFRLASSASEAFPNIDDGSHRVVRAEG